MSGNDQQQPPIPTLGRRPSNPFTRNQDERDEASVPQSRSSSSGGGIAPSSTASQLISKFRKASITSSLTPSRSRDSIAEEDDDNEDDEDLEPVPFKDPKAYEGKSIGAGTGVFEPASSQNNDPEGIPFHPTLRPAGGNERRVETDGMRAPDDLYAGGNEVGTSIDRSTSADAARGTGRAKGVHRTYSMAQQKRRPAIMNDDRIIRQRRLSHDAIQEAPRRFIVDVEETMRLVLEQEDTDGNFQISITDSGPKVLSLGTATSNGYKGVDIRGVGCLHLLQKLRPH